MGNKKVIIMGDDEKVIAFYAEYFNSNDIQTLTCTGQELPEDVQTYDCVLLLTDNRMIITESFFRILETLDDIPVLPVMPEPHYRITNLIYQHNVSKICITKDIEVVLGELNDLFDLQEKQKEATDIRYIFTYRLKNDILFLAISGSLKKENMKGIKLMFKQLKSEKKLDNVKGVVYLFEEVDEISVNFQTIWTLFYFWEELGIEYKNVFYMSVMERAALYMRKYLEPLGVRHISSIMDLLKEIYPECKERSDEELFETASMLINPD